MQFIHARNTYGMQGSQVLDQTAMQRKGQQLYLWRQQEPQRSKDEASKHETGEESVAGGA